MIRRATSTDTQAVKNLWMTCFTSTEDRDSMPWFFENVYQPANTLLSMEKGQVVASLQRYPHSVMMNGRVLQTSMILGVCTDPAFQHQGHMKKLMELCCDECDHQELMTFIQSEQPELYTPFGFETISTQQRYTITRKNLEPLTNEGIVHEMSVQDLLNLYSSFMRHFNGYYVRTIEGMEKRLRENNALKGKIIAFANAEGQLEGYALMVPDAYRVVIQECIYLNTRALAKMIDSGLRQKATVELWATPSEPIGKLLPKVKVEPGPTTMARINDFVLFNRLYGKEVKTVQEAFEKCSRPPYMNEWL